MAGIKKTLCGALVAAVACCSMVDDPHAGAQQGPQQPLPNPVTPSDRSDRSGRQVGLKEQLRVGLKAVTKADFAFIDLVVLKVEQGKLPRSMVDSTFLWARNRYKTRPGSHRLRPMVYFQPALIARAKKLGVMI